MDVSGSMTDDQKEIVRAEAFWIDAWLKSQYDGVTTRYIIHDAVAREVDEHTFYHTRESGGTRISSAYNLANKIIDDQHPQADWNIYVFHFSDGDNWGEDNRHCISLLRDHLLPKCNLFCYGQVESPYGSGEFYRELEEAFEDEENLALSEIRNKEGIYDSIKEFLGRGQVTLDGRQLTQTRDDRDEETPSTGDGDQCVAIRDIGWKGYSTLLRLRGERCRCRAWSTSMGRCGSCLPLFRTNGSRNDSAWVVEVVVEELDIPCIAAGINHVPPPGQARRRRGRSDLLSGQRRAQSAARTNFISRPTHLRTWRSRPSTATMPTRRSRSTAGSKFPRSGSATKTRCVILVLQPNGRYAESPRVRHSRSFRRPKCTTGCSRPQTESDTEWIKQLRTWVKRTLKPASVGTGSESRSENEIQQR